MNNFPKNLSSVLDKIKNINRTVAGLAILLLIAAVALFVFRDRLYSPSPTTEDNTKALEDPLDVTLDFYNQWLAESKSTTTNPFQSGLLNSPLLSAEVRTQIENSNAKKKEGDIDPVLCIPNPPKRVGGKILQSQDGRAVILMLPRSQLTKTNHQAIVSLTVVDGKWQITKLDCLEGESAPEKEFTFEKTGFLVKESIEPPYSKDSWHLVYEQETQPGYVVPLTFTAESVCIGTDGSESVCNPSELKEVTKVLIQADMTETGAIVKRMTFQ
jgi:hypothetical protein